jgi:hypothetical protein
MENDTLVELENFCADLLSLKQFEAFPSLLLRGPAGRWLRVQECCQQMVSSPEELPQDLFATWLPDPTGVPEYAVILFFDAESLWTTAANHNRGRVVGPASHAEACLESPREPEQSGSEASPLASPLREDAEKAIGAQLQSSGFLVTPTVVNRLRIVIAERSGSERMGVLIRARERLQGDVESAIHIGDSAILVKFEEACREHNLEPWLAFYVRANGEVYLTSLSHYQDQYRGRGQIPSWKMEQEDRERYARDSQVKHICVLGSTAFPMNWF